MSVDAPRSHASGKRNLATVETMWRREVEAAHTYALLAEREPNPKRRDILTRLAEQESRHA
jgi:rubrerythrin